MNPIEPRPTPPSYADCRLSNLVLEGGRSVCRHPELHQGQCGVDLSEPDWIDRLNARIDRFIASPIGFILGWIWLAIMLHGLARWMGWL
jgi:hypothetical protein